MKEPSIVKNSVFLYLRLIFTLGVSLYSSRVLLDVLGIEDYGIFNVVAGFISLTFFFKNTLADASQRYLSIELGKGDLNNYNKVYSMCINLHVVLAFILVIFFITFGYWFIEYKMIYPEDRHISVICVYIVAVINFLFGIITAPYMGVIVSYEQMNIYAYLSILNISLKLISILSLKIIPENIDKLIIYSILLLLSTIIESFIIYIYIKRRFYWIKYKYNWNKPLFFSILSFSSWNAISSCAILLISQGSNILLNLFFGPIINAANGIAYQVMGAVRQFSSSFQSAINPRLTKLFAQREHEKMINLCIIGSKMSFFLFLIFGSKYSI